MAILSNMNVAWTKFEYGTDMPYQMKDLTGENNVKTITCQK